MNLATKTSALALAGAILASTAAFSTANAAPMIRVAPVETSQATQVGYYGGYYGGYGYGYKHHCFWKKKRFWGYYGYYWKRVRICY